MELIRIYNSGRLLSNRPPISIDRFQFLGRDSARPKTELLSS